MARQSPSGISFEKKWILATRLKDSFEKEKAGAKELVPAFFMGDTHGSCFTRGPCGECERFFASPMAGQLRIVSGVCDEGKFVQRKELEVLLVTSFLLLIVKLRDDVVDLFRGKRLCQEASCTKLECSFYIKFGSMC